MNESGSTQDAAQLAAHLAPTLALLRTVAAEANITRAAHLLDMPQPTVSRALAALGEHLGTPLIARQGRGIHLTRVGALLAHSAEEALLSLETRCRAVIEELDPAHGLVALGFQHTMGSMVVPALISRFRRRFPKVRFELAQGSRDELIDRVVRGELDLCLTSPPADRPECAASVIRSEPLVVVLFTGHRLGRRREIRLRELANEDFIANRPEFGLRQLITKLAEAAGFTPRLAFECEEVDTMRGLVAAGLGVALLPPAEGGPAPGTVEIPLSPAAHRSVGLAWPITRALPPAVREFRDFAGTATESDLTLPPP